MTTDNHFDPATSVEVLIGAPVDGKIRTWNGDQARTWVLDDDTEIESLWGTGAVGTVPVGQGEYRDAGVLDTANCLLCVAVTTPISKFGGYVDDHRHFELTPLDPSTPDLPGDPWGELQDIISMAAAHTFDRGEVLVVGGTDPTGPSVTLGRINKDLRRSAIVSAVPAPTSELWPMPEADALDRTSIITDYGVAATLEMAFRTVDALQSWNIDPLDVTLTYVSPIELMTSPLPWDAIHAAQ